MFLKTLTSNHLPKKISDFLAQFKKM